MKIKQLDLKNFRGFEEEHSVVFHETLPTVIVGVNGSGKTSILDAIGILLGIELSQEGIVNAEESISLRQSDMFNAHKDIFLRQSYQSYQNFDLQDFPTTETHFSFFQGTVSSQLSGVIFSEISSNLFTDQQESIPILTYQQTNRSINAEAIKSYSVDISVNKRERLNAYKNIFSEQIELADVVGWYVQQINLQNALKVEKGDMNYELSSIRNLLLGINKFLNVLSSNEFSDFGIEQSTYSSGQVLTIKKKNKSLEFIQLSAGEKMLIGLALDIAYRMSVGNSKNENPLLSEGIVLIDELELHLHPKWQANVLDALHQTFPNIQFIVTTHSPLVINNLKKEQLVLIDNAKILQGDKIAEVYGKDAGWIIEYLMGVPTRPKEIEERIAKIWGYLDDDNLEVEKAKKELAELRQIIDPNDSELLELDTVITLEETGDEIFSQG